MGKCCFFFFLATVIIVVLHDTSAVLRDDAEKEDPFPVVNLNGPSANTIGSIARADPVDEENGIRSCFFLFFFFSSFSSISFLRRLVRFFYSSRDRKEFHRN